MGSDRERLDPGEPFTRDQLVAALAHVSEVGASLLDALPPDVFFAPQGAKWSPSEHVRHLRTSGAPVALALRLPGWALRLRFGRPRGGSRSFAALRTDYRAALAAGGDAGKYAPRHEAPPPDPLVRRRAVMRAWLDVNADVSRRLAAWPDAGLDAAQVPHPLLGPLTLREVAGFTVYHTVHHLDLVLDRAGIR